MLGGTLLVISAFAGNTLMLMRATLLSRRSIKISSASPAFRPLTMQPLKLQAAADRMVELLDLLSRSKEPPTAVKLDSPPTAIWAGPLIENAVLGSAGVACAWADPAAKLRASRNRETRECTCMAGFLGGEKRPGAQEPVPGEKRVYLTVSATGRVLPALSVTMACAGPAIKPRMLKLLMLLPGVTAKWAGPGAWRTV